MKVIPPDLPKALEGAIFRGPIPEACVVEAIYRSESENSKWVLSVLLKNLTPSEFVPETTKWLVLVEELYPFGKIEFFPAAAGGLEITFPHQTHNQPPLRNSQEMRQGSICLITPFRTERVQTSIIDPIGDSENRLAWYLQRALAWLEAASTRRLLSPGDPFEVPSIPMARGGTGQRFVHDESESCFDSWKPHFGSWGTLSTGLLTDIPNVLVITGFHSGFSEIRAWSGRPCSNEEKPIAGFWWLWHETIVLEPWQTPTTWGQLKAIGQTQGIDAEKAIQFFVEKMRNTGTPRILLLGYPIPLRVGEEPREVFWCAVELPNFWSKKSKRLKAPPKGTSPWMLQGGKEAFGDNSLINYLPTENWAPVRLQARGGTSSKLKKMKLVVLGVGALGSILAELLVRGGLEDISLIDGDSIEAGNICRHINTLDEIGKNKVEAVGRRLRQISPNVRVTETRDRFAGTKQQVEEMLGPFQVICDCTGSNAVLSNLGLGWWSIPRVFTSFSLGFEARRLFSYCCKGFEFPVSEFMEKVNPFLGMDAENWSSKGEVLEGAGCWSPLFPARYDDIVMAATICLREIESFVSNDVARVRFRAFERAEPDETFQGFRLCESQAKPTKHE
jgi:hypothetical protein